ncbi:MAG: flagellar biosynthesis protein FlhB [Lachnospiraceae bacterium]|nr:flagellar biosynthesis protein FlhB [Lachnospiraceae bacterium]
MSELYLIQFDLQFFSPQEGPGGEKTEAATPKRLSDARKKGQVAKSKELTNAFGLMALFVTLKVFVGFVGSNLINIFKWTYQNRMPDFVESQRDGVSVQAFISLIFPVILRMLLILAPFLIAGVMVCILGEIVQVGWQVSAEPMKPNLNKMNPINGFKRIFSKKSIFELIKSILKVGIIFWVAYNTLKDRAGTLFILYDINLKGAIALVGDIVIDTGLKISLLYFVIGLMDYIYQKRKFNEDMKMTKQEVKDEFKDTEGDPQIKQKQRQKMQEVSQRRMMQSVPDADVVITNPTHIAVALKYDSNESTAPIVVAKGEDYVANKIKEVAKENGILITENKPLARALYATVDIGQEIPPELYEAVAEILALVYNSRNLV